MPMQPRIVLLSQGYIYADAVLKQLSQARVKPSAVVFEVNPPRPNKSIKDKIKNFLAKREGPEGELTTYQRQWWDSWSRAGYAEKFVIGGRIKEKRLVEAIQAQNPDYLVICSAGLVSAEIISCAKKGVINFHPALLPWCRGVGVVERSLQRQVAVGATLYYVATGIDTGRIIRREIMPVTAADDLASLRSRAYDLCIRLMVEELIAISRGRHPEAIAQNVKYPYCKLLTPEEIGKLEQEVKNGLAIELYQRWRSYFGSDVLPQAGNPGPETPIAPKELLA